MVNPILTLLFDVFLIGSALGVMAWMFGEYLESRRPFVGAKGPEWRWAARPRSAEATSWERPDLRRSA